MNLKRLEAAAKAATQEKWEVVGKSGDCAIIRAGAFDVIASSEWTYLEDYDANYIAEANPANILELLTLVHEMGWALERVGRDQYPVIEEALTKYKEAMK